MVEGDLQTLLVSQAHLMNPILVHMDSLLVFEGSQKLVKVLSYPFYYIWFLDPN